ncbi:MAG: helix-turn-helix domain-containing protein [Ferrimicrobium sp.]
MITAHKIRLERNSKQANYLARAAETARFAYNWGLARWKEQHELHKIDLSVPAPSQYTFRRELNSIKRERFPPMMEVSKGALEEALVDLGASFASFPACRSRYPKFKKKGVHDAFTLSSGAFGVDEIESVYQNSDTFVCQSECVVMDVCSRLPSQGVQISAPSASRLRERTQPLPKDAQLDRPKPRSHDPR